MNEIQSYCIAWTRFILSVLVVFIHIPHPSEIGLDFSLYAFISQGIARVAVPAFFVISGYLFSIGLEDDWSWPRWWGKVKKRLLTVLIPYLLWNLIFALLINVYHFFPINNQFEIGWLPRWLESNDGVWGIFLGWGRDGYVPLNYPLWFMRDLIVMFLLSPLLFLLLRKTHGLFLYILVIPLIFDWRIPLPGFSTEAILFFSCGMYCQMKRNELFQPSCRLFKTQLIVLFLLLVLESILYGRLENIALIIRHLIELVGTPFTFVLLCRYLSLQKWDSDFLTSSSFFLYASHVPFIWSSVIFPLWIYPTLQGQFEGTFAMSSFLLYLILGVVVILFCLLFYLVIYKYMPYTRKLLCVGR